LEDQENPWKGEGVYSFQSIRSGVCAGSVVEFKWRFLVDLRQSVHEPGDIEVVRKTSTSRYASKLSKTLVSVMTRRE